MKTKLIKNLKSRVLLVEVPENAFRMTITDQLKVADGKGSRLTVMYLTRAKKSNETIDDYYNECLVKHQELGKWQLLSTLKDLKDSDCEGLVSDYDRFNGTDYNSPKESFLSALESEKFKYSDSTLIFIEQ